MSVIHTFTVKSTRVFRSRLDQPDSISVLVDKYNPDKQESDQDSVLLMIESPAGDQIGIVLHSTGNLTLAGWDKYGVFTDLKAFRPCDQEFCYEPGHGSIFDLNQYTKVLDQS